MVRLRLAAAALLVGFLSTFAAPCLAAAPDQQTAMACCAKMQMAHACGDHQIAQACCRASDASQHDRDVQPTRVVAKLVLDAVLAPAAAVVTPWHAPSRIAGSRLAPGVVPLSPACFTPLLI